MKMRRLCAYIMALLLAASMPLTAFAVEADVSQGNVAINDTSVSHTKDGTERTDPHEGKVTVIQSNPSTPTNHNVSVNTSSGSSVNVTLKDVNIDVSGNSDKAAVEVTGSGNVTIELDGTSTVKSGDNHAGVEKSNSGNLTITGDNETADSLTATGGKGGAGIGGGKGSNGSDITISGGTVNANGGENAAGIGGGAKTDANGGGNGSKITISGGTVTANGGYSGAGIGGAQGGTGSNITISDGTVNANGGEGGAGIGGGGNGEGRDIAISSTVNAKGGTDAAGIGGGTHGNGSNITISGGTVNATGGDAPLNDDGSTGQGGGAGIGGGAYGSGDNITVKFNAQVTAEGKGNAANIGNGTSEKATEKQKDKVDLSGLSSFGKVNGVSGGDGGFHASDGSSSVPLTVGNKATGKAGLMVSDNNGNDLSNALWLEEEGTLKVTAPADNVLVTGNKADLLQLKEDGVKKINLQTNRVNVSVTNELLQKITGTGGGFQLAADDTTVSLSSTAGNNQKNPGLKLTANQQPEKAKLQVDFRSEESKEGAEDVRESLKKTLKVSTNAPEATLSYDRKFLNALMNSEFGKLALAVGNLLATMETQLAAITAQNGSGSISIDDNSVIMYDLEFSAADSSENNKLSDMVNSILLQIDKQAQGGSVLVTEVDAKAAMASASLKVPGSALQSLMDQGIEETALSVNGKTTSFKNSNLLKQIQDSRLGSTATVTDKHIANGEAKTWSEKVDKDGNMIISADDLL
ncbi:MAG: hypothetical protein MSH58_11675 [Clostridiales bacterium]|nr:hypothetical protein [Clostridiales bacterium]